MATLNVRYVDPDAEAGGDGTTNELTGEHCAFTSLSAWNTARFYHLVVNDYIEECVLCSNGGSHTPDTTSAYIFQGGGSYTGPNNYIHIHSEVPLDSPVYDTTKYRHEYANDYGTAHSIAIWADYCRVDGLQLKDITAVANGHPNFVFYSSGGSSTDLRLEKSIFIGTTVPGGSSTTLTYAVNGDLNVRVFNCLVVGSTAGGGLYLQTASINGKIYNNTIVDCKYGLYHDQTSSTREFINNLVKGSDSTYGFGDPAAFADTSDYNSTDDTTSTGGTHDRTEQTFTFAGGMDYRLAASDSGARGQGVSLSTFFTDDLIGIPRASTWDIGAFVDVSGGSNPVAWSVLSIIPGRS